MHFSAGGGRGPGSAIPDGGDPFARTPGLLDICGAAVAGVAGRKRGISAARLAAKPAA